MNGKGRGRGYGAVRCACIVLGLDCFAEQTGLVSMKTKQHGKGEKGKLDSSDRRNRLTYLT